VAIKIAALPNQNQMWAGQFASKKKALCVKRKFTSYLTYIQSKLLTMGLVAPPHIKLPGIKLFNMRHSLLPSTRISTYKEQITHLSNST
jgi:hypothetical protein